MVDLVDLKTPLLEDGVARIRFFNGRLVTSKDMDREQASRDLADARVAQSIGTGVVRGLSVRKAPEGGSEVIVDPGLAVASDGTTLRLARAWKVRLVSQAKTSAQKPSAVGFHQVAPPSGHKSTGQVVPVGWNLLVVSPTCAEVGKARVVALDSSTVGCNTDTLVVGVQLRLVPVTDLEIASSPYAVRAQLASRFFGSEEPSSHHMDLLSRMRKSGLDDPRGFKAQDVPLALVRLDGLGNVDLVDMWAVRRRIHLPMDLRGASEPVLPLEAPWAGLLLEGGDATGEARRLQFQDQLEDWLSSGIAGVENELKALPERFGVSSAEIAEEKIRSRRSDTQRSARFDGYLAAETEISKGRDPAVVFPVLPACGFYPRSAVVGWKTFFSASVAHLPDDPSRMPVVDRQAAHTILRATLCVPSASRADAGKIRLARVEGLDDWLLFHFERAAIAGGTEISYDPGTVQNLTWKEYRRDTPPGNLQEAVEALYSWNADERIASVMHSVTPVNFAAVRARVAKDLDVNLFFEAGEFSLASSWVLEGNGAGHLRIQGVGGATRLVSEVEACLVVRGFASCTVVDMSFASMGGGSSPEKGADPPSGVSSPGLEGAISIQNVGSVHLERIHARIGGSRVRDTAAISVYGGGSTSVRIRDCRVEVGASQVGILVVDGRRVVIRGNVVEGSLKGPKSPSVRKIHHLAELAAQYIELEDDEAQNLRIKPVWMDWLERGKLRVWALEKLWNDVHESQKHVKLVVAIRKAFDSIGHRSSGEYLERYDKGAEGLLEFAKTVRKKLLESTGFAHRGIAVTGTASGEVQVEENAVVRVAQGIVATLSGRVGGRRQENLQFADLVIRDNRVDTGDLAWHAGDRSALILGGARRLVCSGNRLKAPEQSWRMPVEGIRVRGRLERLAILERNHLQGFDVGIRFYPGGSDKEEADNRGEDATEAEYLWLLRENLMEGVGESMDIDSRFQKACRVADNVNLSGAGS